MAGAPLEGVRPVTAPFAIDTYGKENLAETAVVLAAYGEIVELLGCAVVDRNLRIAFENRLVVSQLEDRTFLQRRMASSDEQEKVIRQLRDRNIDPSGQEADGNLVAEFFLSRPTEEVRQQPLSQLLEP